MIATADMSVADKNLRHRVPTGTRDHLLAHARILIDIDFLEVQMFLRQQVLGPHTVWTPVCYIQRHGRLTHLPALLFTTGMWSLRQPFKPPCRLNTLVKPSLLRARAELTPSAPL